MKEIKKLLSRLLGGESLTESEESRLADFAGSASLEDDRLQQLQSEFDRLSQAHSQLRRQLAVGEISREHKCLDANYLEYLAGREGLDFDDPSAVEKFIAQAKQLSPRLFETQLQQGSGMPDFGFNVPENAGFPPDRVGQLMCELSQAPELLR